MQSDMIHILVCTYQGEQFIAEQLDSLLAQTYPLIEVHIFDDRSKDNTVNIIQKYCKKHSNFHLHKNTKNVGFINNFESAISSTVEGYIALCDQDDIWHPEKLHVLMRKMKGLEREYPNLPILVHSDLSMIDKKGKDLYSSFFKLKQIKIPENKSLGHILGHCGVMGNTILMNCKLSNMSLPFPSGLIYHDYWLAVIAELFGKRVTVNEPLVHYRIHELNISANNSILKSVPPSKSKWHKRNFKLPFMGNNRVNTLVYLLNNYNLSDGDRKIIEGFCDYLTQKKSRIDSFCFLFRNNFLKGNMKNSIIVFLKILFVRREHQ